MADTETSSLISKANAVTSSSDASERSPSFEYSSPPASPDTKYPANERVSPINRADCPIFAVLQSRSLWRQFASVRTEMIVTRRGRRMFPPIKVELFNLDPSKPYVLLIGMSPVDKFRYKYQNSAWVKCFEEECSPTRLYIHPDSPALGSHWMNTAVSFYKLKLTNNQLDKQGHIIVNSMHNYQPRLHLVESADINNLCWDHFNTFVFPETQFITVTAYQNDKITQLKINHNPFAKGFRSPFSRCRTRHNSSQRCNLPSTSDSETDEASPHTVSGLVSNKPSEELNDLKRSLHLEGEEEENIQWVKHPCHSVKASTETNIMNLNIAPHPQLVAVPTQSFQSQTGQAGGPRFLVLYSVPQASHIAQFPGTAIVQPPLVSGSTDTQLSIADAQVIQSAPLNTVYSPLSQSTTMPFLVQQGSQSNFLAGTTVIPTISNPSALFNNEMIVLQPNTSSPSSVHCPLLEKGDSTHVKPTSPEVSSPLNIKPPSTDRNRIRHPPPLLQLGSDSRPKASPDGPKVMAPAPPPLLMPALAGLATTQPQMANCVQRLVIVGDMGKSQQGPTTMLIPSADQESGKLYSLNQMMSPVPLYRFGTQPIQILTPVGTNGKKS